MLQSLYPEMLAAIRRARARSLAVTDVKYSYDDECSARYTCMHVYAFSASSDVSRFSQDRSMLHVAKVALR